MNVFILFIDTSLEKNMPFESKLWMKNAFVSSITNYKNNSHA
uniref:Uncharacterized protein n=1 Tax=Desulfovibrio desulfuricans (strain ATCC 27774 / DSM 6949 / MB) TaxID=525146 RepID=B8J154_DESDA